MGVDWHYRSKRGKASVSLQDEKEFGERDAASRFLERATPPEKKHKRKKTSVRFKNKERIRKLETQHVAASIWAPYEPEAKPELIRPK